MKIYAVSKFYIVEDWYKDTKDTLYLKGEVVQRGEKPDHITYVFLSESKWAISLFSIIYRVATTYQDFKLWLRRITKRSSIPPPINYEQTEKFDV